VPWYLLLNGTEPRWRLHDTVDVVDLTQSLARVKETNVTIYTLASRNEGEMFQSLTINGKNLDSHLITQENDPDPAKTRSRYEAAGFWQPQRSRKARVASKLPARPVLRLAAAFGDDHA